ncbi:MAG: XRE family transcriptional regulator [Chlamydiota bacterium]|nr:XRE family transcriptional regulator [Chlamydiota bacterium]
MYKDIFERYQMEFKGFPSCRRPRVGSVIKSIRIDKGIRQMDFARKVQINESTLKNIENDHQQSTSTENLTRSAAALGISVKDLLLMGREWDEANYFALKRSAPKKIEGIRIRKRAPIEWYESVRLRMKDFDFTPISAPINTKRDFFCLRVILPPKRSIDKLALGIHNPVIGFLSEGFNLKIQHGGKDYPITSNQAFALDGFFPHSIVNDDEDHAATLYLMTKLPNYEKGRLSYQTTGKESDEINIANAIEHIRELASDRPGRPLSVQHLADLTDHLDYQQMHKLLKLKKVSSTVYWDKIEDILGGTGVSIEDFLEWSHNRIQTPFQLATATTRANTTYLAKTVRIYHATPPGIKNRFLCGELFLEGKKTESWKRRDSAMCALYLEQGELELTVGGKLRVPLPLSKGESIYFDASLGYILRNPTATQAKAFLATYPAIQV